MRLTLTAIASLLLAAGCTCRTPNPTAPPVADHGSVQCGIPEVYPIDPLHIIEAGVVGDSLRIVVEHGGGCAEHSYAIYGCTPTLRTDPAGVILQIAHDANGDMCEALLRRTLHFSLAPIRAAWKSSSGSDHGELNFHLQPPPTSSSTGPVVRFTF